MVIVLQKQNTGPLLASSWPATSSVYFAWFRWQYLTENWPPRAAVSRFLAAPKRYIDTRSKFWFRKTPFNLFLVYLLNISGIFVKLLLLRWWISRREVLDMIDFIASSSPRRSRLCQTRFYCLRLYSLHDSGIYFTFILPFDISISAVKLKL